jgi:hypothetical protein
MRYIDLFVKLITNLLLQTYLCNLKDLSNVYILGKVYKTSNWQESFVKYRSLKNYLKVIFIIFNKN